MYIVNLSLSNLPYLSNMNAKYPIYPSGAAYKASGGTISHYKAQSTTKNAQLVDETKAQRSMNHVDGNSIYELNEHVGHQVLGLPKRVGKSKKNKKDKKNKKKEKGLNSCARD
jgi:hypothetical protein